MIISNKSLVQASLETAKHTHRGAICTRAPYTLKVFFAVWYKQKASVPQRETKQSLTSDLNTLLGDGLVKL